MKKYRLNRGNLLFALLLSVLFIPFSLAQATSVDHVSLCNVVAVAGKITEIKINLEGTDPEERSGFWYTYYKKSDGDDKRMDISSWITTTPQNFTINNKEKETFTVRIKVPRNTEPGLYGATSPDACKEGNTNERRTYLVFKDANTGGNVYSGFLIPVSVKVQSPQGWFSEVTGFLKDNIVTTILAVVIIVLLAAFVPKRWRRSKK